MAWRVELDVVWDVLGPFPIHAREQHFLSPAYPLDLNAPIDTTATYPTSLTHTAYASWSQTAADCSGTIHVSHPTAPWDQIRAVEGWAGLQHMNVLRGWLAVYPPSDAVDDILIPFLRTELVQGAFFAILPPPDSPERWGHVPEWHYGNIYALERTPVQLVRLPVSPARNKNGAKYEVIICAPYEIRLFGDPLAYSSSYPILTLKISVSLQFPSTSSSSRAQYIKDAPLEQILLQSIAPHIVDGTPFGDAIGIGIQCLDSGHQTRQGQGYWSIVRACLTPTSVFLPPSLSVELLNEAPVRIAPTQTRIIPLRLRISPSERISVHVKELHVELTCVPFISLCQAATDNTMSYVYDETKSVTSTFVLRATFPLTHVPLWTRKEHVPIQASFFFANSMPSVFVVKPPRETIGRSQAVSGQVNSKDGRGNEPILALHGAGVDIRTQSFWPDSLPRQKYAWVVMPDGRTAWGLDWHGPSAADAFAAVSALSHILSSTASGRWDEWGFNANTRVILMGHSNGGQGAWYMAGRWPDRVCAVVPAAGYIKSQAYVSWCMSRFAHFIDPALRAVLDTSLTPDDDDLFLGNLVGKPVLALHGGADDNVPVWHTREQVGVLKTWDLNADVIYHEDPGRPHWYPEVLYNERVQAFLDRVYFSSPSRAKEDMPGSHALTTEERKSISFTLTVAVPIESGSLNGWQIHVLTTPGLLGRLRVTVSPDGHVSIRTTNVSVFSLDPGTWAATCDDINKGAKTVIDDEDITGCTHFDSSEDKILFVRVANTAEPLIRSSWKVSPCSDPSVVASYHLRAPPRRLQSVLSTCAPLTLLVPSLVPSPELSAAVRIAHALQLFHALDAQIVSVTEAGKPEPPASTREGNLIVVGCADTPLVQRWLKGSIWSYANQAWHVGTIRLDRPSSAILFCQPHPYDEKSTTLFVQFIDPSGLERAIRLFPIRTGVLSPDWLVVDGRADSIGAAGVQGAGVYSWEPPSTSDQDDQANKWLWNERMSWLD